MCKLTNIWGILAVVFAEFAFFCFWLYLLEKKKPKMSLLVDYKKDLNSGISKKSTEISFRSVEKIQSRSECRKCNFVCFTIHTGGESTPDIA